MTYEEFYSDYKWIKVKRYKMDESKSWEDRYKDLDEHHLNETTLLIEEVRHLAKKLDSAEMRKDVKLPQVKKNKYGDDIIGTIMTIWFTFSVLIAVAINILLDEQTQFHYYHWILAVTLIAGGLCSYLFCRWTQKHEKDT